jgi:hypothetical protein
MYLKRKSRIEIPPRCKIQYPMKNHCKNNRRNVEMQVAREEWDKFRKQGRLKAKSQFSGTIL